MKPVLPLFIMIDAMGWEILRDEPFGKNFAPTRKKLESVFGYSSTCVPSILSGRWPFEHRNWCYFVYDPKNSPFRPLRWMRWPVWATTFTPAEHSAWPVIKIPSTSRTGMGRLILTHRRSAFCRRPPASSTFVFWHRHQTNIIQATTNFTAWTPVLTNTAGIYNFTDSNSAGYPFRFYRAVLGP